MENYYQYSFYNKPWNKISVYSLGIMSAMLYIDIFKSPDKSAFAKFIVRDKGVRNGGNFKHYFPWFMFFVAFAIYITAAFISFPI